MGSQKGTPVTCPWHNLKIFPAAKRQPLQSRFLGDCNKQFIDISCNAPFAEKDLPPHLPGKNHLE
jgi:hypothetical protein